MNFQLLLCRQVCNPILPMFGTTAEADRAAKVTRMLMMPSLRGVLTTCTLSSVIDQKILFKLAGASLVKLQWIKYAHRESHTRNFNADDGKQELSTNHANHPALKLSQMYWNRPNHGGAIERRWGVKYKIISILLTTQPVLCTSQPASVRSPDRYKACCCRDSQACYGTNIDSFDYRHLFNHFITNPACIPYEPKLIVITFSSSWMTNLGFLDWRETLANMYFVPDLDDISA